MEYLFFPLSLMLVGCSSTKDSSIDISENAPKPNILFIYTDDQAPWAIGSSGNKQAVTPNMDELAKLGISFPNGYTTTPVCSPSRAGLLTSKYGFELGIDDWINTHYKPAAMNGLEPELGLSQKEITWPELLQENGYYTGLIGKWHLGIQSEHHPTLHGYDEFIGFTKGGTKTSDPVLEIDSIEKKVNGLTADILTDYAIDFLSRKSDKPFLLSLHYRAPHTRWLPVAPEDEAPYKNMDIILPDPDYPNLNAIKNKRFMKEYLSSVRSVDRNLGVLIEHLKSLSLYDNTLIIFTSDHGYNMGHNGIWHKGNGHWLLNTKVKNDNKNIPTDQKPNMYDNSIKVPTLVVWKGKIQPSSVNLTTLSNLDWFPTLMDVAGIEYDATNIRGKSVMPALLNPNKVISTDYYAAYTTKHQSITGMRMYSDGKHKLVKDFINPNRDEFYDLVNDSKESFNIISSDVQAHKNKIKEFSQIIYDTMIKTNDPLQDLLQE
ncbi:N-acetylgalactosamine 6-sulfate sulfatase [Thalassotalea euphylliae]|uniref:N-acetylgalactosamine 6-sulfate sulfatase n=2 Tax=Thalassotalea euphylliae TaxID=1655234 RepID=A0A3E0TUY5_9GAMM|nr:N-acetylgalactosamine 6-sulfate sulfatase [Thalassotalea euphylliae]